MVDVSMTFHPPLKEVAKLLGRSLADTRRLIALKLYEKITRKSPVDTGRLRASWFMSDGIPSNDVQDEGGSSYPPQGVNTATFTDPFTATYIVNNLPYVARIEFEGHSSVKAPAGMVRVSLAELEAELGSYSL